MRGDVETLTISAIVKEGAKGLRKIYQNGVTAQDFPTYDEEIAWIEDRAINRQPINPRLFRRRFPDFEWLVPSEPLKELLLDLKNERAFMETRALIETLSQDLEVDNAVSMAEMAREALGTITRLHAPHSDILLIGGWKERFETMKQLRKLRQAGIEPGIPTGLSHIDFHWDGLVGGRYIVILGRPGEAKSYLCAQFMWSAIHNKFRALLISPEMNRHEHECRLHTLASADPEVQEALGLEHSFRNRALMTGHGFNLKSYRRLLEYLEGECGEAVLLTQTHRKNKMTVPFVEARIEEMQPDVVFIDPIYKLKAPHWRDNPWHQLSDISEGIELLAESYNIPIIVTNQAHRQGGERDDAPHKDKSHGSDVPVQEADHVIGVKHVSDEHRLILRCSKSRFGADFRFECRFFPNTGILRPTTDPSGSYYNGSDDLEEEEVEEIVRRATRGGTNG